MTWKERRQYWRQSTRVQARIEQEYFPKVQKVINQQLSSFIEDARREGWMKAYHAWNMEVTKGDLFTVIMSLYKKSGITFANMTRKAVRSGLKYRTMGFNAQWTKDIIEYLGRMGLQLVNWMEDTTKQWLIDIISQGLTEGWGFDEITNKIMDSPIADRWRILRIVRTESMRAGNYGAVLGAKSHGLLMDKLWISAHDERVRQWSHKDQFDHLALDGTLVAMDKPFEQVSLKGIKAEAQQPGDPNAPAAFTVNCRCVVAFEPKRDANGRLIRVS
jgi:hypothetical protein